MKSYHIFTLFLMIFICSECRQKNTFSPENGNEENYNDSLINTQWVLIRYDNGTTPYYPNDTLIFLTDSKYSINSSPITNNFNLYSVNGTYNLSLTLFNCSSLGGSYAGQLSQSFISMGEANNVQFQNLYTSTKLRIWMVRLN